VKVTFDTNAWQPVVRPDLFAKDPRVAEFQLIHDALVQQRCQGFICETVCTLEAVKKTDRRAYFGAQKPKIRFEETDLDGVLRLNITMGPDHSLHPGLHPILADRIKEAIALGMRFLQAPRVGTPSPPELIDESGNPRAEVYAQVDAIKRQQEHETFGKLTREIENRGVGISVGKAIAARIAQRTGISGQPWFQHFLEPAADATEERDIVKAVAEWADADSISAHVASGNDVFCTEDQGKSAGVSILDADNRSWLSTHHAVSFVTLKELASLLPPA